MSWRRVLKSIQALAAHCFLFSFTLLLVLKLDHTVSCSWWAVFLPLWASHAVVARGRFSLPAPLVPRNRHWAPCHAVVATPLLVAFELLLCIYLESSYGNWPPAVSLKIASLPLLAFEVTILIDNLRMCRALMPDDDSINDDAIWEALPGNLVKTQINILRLIVSFLPAAFLGCYFYGVHVGCYILHPPKAYRRCSFSQLVGSIYKYWNCRVLCFSCIYKWSNPVIHRNSRARETGSSSTAVRYLDWNSGLVVTSEEDRHQDRMCCGLQDIGGHMLKIPIIVFQVVLCMHLEGTPERAKDISIPVLFSPLFLLQGLGVLFAASKLIEKIVVLLRGEAGPGLYFRFSSRAHDCLGFLHHGSRLLGWWSIDEGSREEQARLYLDGETGYNTFSGHPPEIVKKMPKEDLAEEVWRLQAALGEQTEITKFSQQEYERLQNEKVLCRVCFEREISLVLLPCRHRVLCRICSEKCTKCPICRIYIGERLPVYDV